MRTITFHYFNSNFLIRWRFGTPVTHVGVEFDSGTYYESRPIEGNIKLLKPEFKKKPDLSVTIEVSDQYYYRARQAAASAVGRGYDFKAIIGFIIGVKYQDNDDFFCSELGRKVFEAATDKKIKLSRLCTPYDLYLITATHAYP